MSSAPLPFKPRSDRSNRRLFRISISLIALALLVVVGVLMAHRLWRPVKTHAVVHLDVDDPTVVAAQGHGHNADYMARHQEYVALAAKGGIDLLFLGDSITDDMHHPEMADFWRRTWEPLHAANFGIDHDKTQNLLWRVTHGELDGVDPKVAVVLIGTNNTEANTAPRIAQGITAVVKAVRRLLPRTRVLLMGVFPRNPKPTSPKRQIIRDVNAMVCKLADGDAIQYLDIGDKFLEPDGSLSQKIMPDGLHPSEKGYQIWADQIMPVVTRLMALPRLETAAHAER